MPRTIIHAGMPRTASTFFQNQVFPKIEGFDFIDVATTQYSTPFQKLLYQDESLYNENEIKSQIGSTGGNQILSNELFAGQSLYLASTNRSRNFQRLKSIYPEAEILLFLRNQADLLESLYAIGIYAGINADPHRFIKFNSGQSSADDPFYPSFEPRENTESYFYSPLLQLVNSHFEKVHLFLFEEFTLDPPGFIRNFSSKLDLELSSEINFSRKANPSLGRRQIEYLRKINHVKPLLGKRLYRRSTNIIEHRLRGTAKYKFPDSLRSRLKEYFKEDNERLGKLLPASIALDLFRKYYF